MIRLITEEAFVGFKENRTIVFEHSWEKLNNSVVYPWSFNYFMTTKGEQFMYFSNLNIAIIDINSKLTEKTIQKDNLNFDDWVVTVKSETPNSNYILNWYLKSGLQSHHYNKIEMNKLKHVLKNGDFIITNVDIGYNKEVSIKLINDGWFDEYYLCFEEKSNFPLNKNKIDLIEGFIKNILWIKMKN